ncbi:hypothetical protein [Alkalihalobacillus hemicellulosilyticus]|uniref:Uncharacterized protein n=1 Tax=Halalkalibacter hemicellulosilyticusJCM 9152 TaxID=1236971 RepID=W4QL74_9BACI|nr:hypothetical protein [Halalkalibacter hemicellulosilyticus]GAE32652.1 hypothetical protein JCM9152_4196 [Halalkalibacter hemicellulosilyticusJCM 9152]
MQEFVFFIEGRVQHPLTIDPTVWIFDERKVDLNTYFNEQANKEDADTIYKKAISAQWDKEILEALHHLAFTQMEMKLNIRSNEKSMGNMQCHCSLLSKIQNLLKHRHL